MIFTQFPTKDPLDPPPPSYNYSGAPNQTPYPAQNYQQGGTAAYNYTTVPNAPPQNMTSYPGGGYYQPQAQMYQPAPAGYMQPVQQNAFPPNASTVYVPQVQYDGDARFSPNCPPIVPPPPPGYAPNPAQQLSQAGFNVQVPQGQYARDPGWTLW
ncbi:unnamed protein product [Echinostoma caproni]|uniref:DAZ-associated protein 2 n=1 Tax=Echinostoma caproni TaxID=27848 RepID=A0A183A770_9TREM|nr:unnamed protein product [Echinostoma caproni]